MDDTRVENGPVGVIGVGVSGVLAVVAVGIVVIVSTSAVLDEGALFFADRIAEMADGVDVRTDAAAVSGAVVVSTGSGESGALACASALREAVTAGFSAGGFDVDVIGWSERALGMGVGDVTTV